ncbi:methyltransferase domain-containing protein [Nonomuraea sp. NPDC050783]|uniref:methyltransferase domain-containing protein n=1 Tax=Nonomuraea sp. NPDC050783 TaxID=3154634 RepID=UPI003465C3D2
MSDIERRSRVESLLRQLDAVDAMPGSAELRELSYELLRLPAGAGVVDVGCGGGRAVAELAGRGARAIGVDLGEEMIEVARHRWPEADFRLGDACALPLEDGSVAGYRADKLFHQLADPLKALAEARRVLVPGGRVVLVGQDWDTLVIDSDDPALTRALVHARADLVPAPRVARRHRNLLLDAGFEEVHVEVRTGVFTDAAMLPVLTDLAGSVRAAGGIDAGQEEAWVAEQRRRAGAGRMFLAVPFFVAAATRP